MADKKHLAILKKGVAAWDQWREQHPDIRPDLEEGDLYKADLAGANLSGANLSGANLGRANLGGTDFSEAALAFTVLADVDLSAAKGLETVRHIGPSTIGVDTIYRSQGKIP